MKNLRPNPQLAFSQHDHRQCELTLLQTARQLCLQRSVRLTRRRQQVLQILLTTHRPLGAYDILESMNREESGITPPIVYRALDFLLQQGLIHRIESRNAYTACMQPGHAQDAQFLICSRCQRVAELQASPGEVLGGARRLGFKALHTVIEITGLCASCRH